MPKRKLLGGVSFDGGAGGGGKQAAPAQTGVQTAQPSFSDVSEYGFGIGQNVTSNSVGKGVTGGQRTDGKGARDTVSIRETSVTSLRETTDTDKIASVIVPAPQEESRRFDFKLKKYVRKMQSGIRTFLEQMGQRTNTGSGRRHRKKEENGTRMVREESAFTAAETDYLLDSYNRRGERSTLGKE